MEGLLQPTHLILILGVILLLFGPKKLPEFGQGLGKGIRGFKEALRGTGDDAKDSRARDESLATPSPSVKVSKAAKE